MAIFLILYIFKNLKMGEKVEKIISEKKKSNFFPMPKQKIKNLQNEECRYIHKVSMVFFSKQLTKR